MATLSIRIDDDIKARWQKLSRDHGLNQSHFFREAIIDKLEELEDFYIVRDRLDRRYETISDVDVWKRLRLED